MVRRCCCFGRQRPASDGVTFTDAGGSGGSGSQPLAPLGGVPSSWKGYPQECWEMLKLALPMFVSMASFSVMKATDSSLLGHSGTEYLEAVALSDLWTSSTGVFIQSRAAGPLCAQAFGAGQKHLVGVWIQVAWTVLFSVSVFVAITWCLTGPVLRALGKDPVLSSEAEYFAVVLLVCLPVRICYSQLSLFFSSQKVVWPTTIVTTVGVLSNLFFGLIFVLGFPIPGFKGFGFAACPWVTTVIEYGQFALYWYITCYSRKLHRECWPGWSRSNITKANISEYLKQYVYQSLSLASDFWRVSAIGAIASTLGDVNVAVWNTSYRICWIVLMFSNCVGAAMSIQVGQSLGRGDALSAKRQVMAGVIMASIILAFLCILVASIPRYFGMIFSNDPVVLDLFAECRFTLTAFVGLMNLAVVFEKIPIAVGRTKTLFWMGVVGSWVGQVPGAYLCVKYWRDDSVGLYLGSALGYGLLCVLLGGSIWRFDWDELVAEAQARVRNAAAREERENRHGASLQPVQEGSEEKKEDSRAAS